MNTNWAYPSCGEIAFAVATYSGLAPSNADLNPDRDFYEALKQYQRETALHLFEIEQRCLDEIEQRVTERLPRAAGVLLDLWQRFISGYRDMSARIPAECLTRTQLVDEILWPCVFSNDAAHALKRLHHYYGIVNLASLLRAPSTVGYVINTFLTLNTQSRKDLVKAMSAGSARDVDNVERQLRRWISGHTGLPSAQLETFSKAIHPSDPEAALAWLTAASMLSALDGVKRQQIAQMLPVPVDTPLDVGILISRMNAEAGEKAGPRPFQVFGDLIPLLLQVGERKPGDREQAWSLLQSFESETRSILGAASPLARLRGRFWIYDGDLSRARDELSLALKQALHRDTDVGWIRFELMLVAAQLNDRPILKRCKLQMDEFSPRSPPIAPEEWEGWLAFQWIRHFPPQHRFSHC